jgi:hypothetical protein
VFDGWLDAQKIAAWMKTPAKKFGIGRGCGW